MKSKTLLLLLLIILLPIIVNAEDYCEVISGNGKDIGSEIACGEEHFYIISSNDNEVKALAKYNISVGYIINKIKVDNNKTYIKEACQEDPTSPSEYTCSHYYNGSKFYFENEEVNNRNEWENRLKQKYNLDYLDSIAFPSDSQGKHAFYYDEEGDMYEENGQRYRNLTYKLYPYEVIDDESYGFQNEKALGVTGEKGNANYPLYGVIHLLPRTNYDVFANSGRTPYKRGYVDFEIRHEPIISFIDDYEDYLWDNGYEISDIDFISIKEIDNIVNEVTGKRLPLVDWYDASLAGEETFEDNGFYKTLGDLKNYLSDDYKWLWNTSYWTKTLVGDPEISNNYSEAYFLASSGEICYSRINCSSGIPRAGIRPVVTLNKSGIMYNIKSKSNGNGTIEVINSSIGGEIIQFKVNANVGYKLSNIVIKTDSGETIELDEGEIVKNKDNIVSITNNFVMPYESITIEATFENIYKFLEGMGQSYNISKDEKLRFRVNMEYKDFIDGGKVYIDKKEVDPKYYELSEGSTIIIFDDEYSKSLSLGKHEIVTKLKDGSSCKTDFTIKESIIDNPIINKIINPNTGDVIILVIVVLLLSLGIYNYLKYKKRKVN